jgi:hypothetical protein
MKAVGIIKNIVNYDCGWNIKVGVGRKYTWRKQESSAG